MENFGMNEVRRCDNPNGDDNDPVKSPTSYPVEGKEPPVVPQRDGEDNDPGKPPGTSYDVEGK